MPGDFVEIHVRGHLVLASGLTKSLLNVRHYRRISGPGGATETDVADQAQSSSWAVALFAALNHTYVGEVWMARFIDSPTSPLTPSTTSPTNGSVSGDRLPSNTCVSVYLKTNMRGRNYRGFQHYTPLSESDTTLDELTSTGLTNWTTVATELGSTFTDAPGNTWKPIVLSRNLSDLTTPSPTIVYADVVTPLLNKTIGQMRHRREKTVR
jgi:hypothetical protein